MEYRQLGRLEVSAVGLGCNNFGMRIDAEQSRAVVDAAIDAGITYFDTAELYSNGTSEEYLGRALQGRRDRVIIATKWGHRRSVAEGDRAGDPAYIRSRLEASLRRLGTDHVDHYQLHQPDPDTPHEEILGCLQDLCDEGKVREIGCTNFDGAMLRAADSAATERGVAPYASVQNHYSVFTRDKLINCK